MKIKSRTIKLALTTIILMALAPTPGYSMHIMEGYLPAKWCGLWYLIAIPFVIFSYRYTKRLTEAKPKLKVMLALSAAFVFILSALKLPSVTGSSSHLTGTTLGTVVVGPWAMPVIGVIVLLFQALLLSHGGISTLGANVTSMVIVGPFASYGIIKLMDKLRVPKNVTLFVATFVGVMSTYITTSFQLALAYPGAEGGVFYSAMKFLGIFALTQVPLAIIEGVITITVLDILLKQGIEAKLYADAKIEVESKGRSKKRDRILLGISAAVVLLIPFAGHFFNFGHASGDHAGEMIRQMQPGFREGDTFWKGLQLSDIGETILFGLQALIGIVLFGYALYRFIRHHKNNK